MTDQQKQKHLEAKKDRQKEYRKNMSDEQKQKRKDYQKEHKRNMTDERKQKLKDYLREYYKKFYAEKKLNNKIIQHDYDDDNDNNKIIKIFNDNLKL